MGNDAKFTPGPWEVDLDSNVRVAGKPYLVAIVKPVGHGISGNAQLIASAPALHAALKAVEWVGNGDRIVCPWCRHPKAAGHAPDCARQLALGEG